MVVGRGSLPQDPPFSPLLSLSLSLSPSQGDLTSVPQLSLLSKWIQFNAAPKRIEPQKRAWSHLKDFKKSFQMKPSSFLWLNSFRRSIRLNLHG